MDMLTENRRAKTGHTATGHCNCGFAFPANMWEITTGWKLYCDMDWGVLEREGQEGPTMTHIVTL
eukprot:533192-Prorocentrum_lima.AAC.1